MNDLQEKLSDMEGKIPSEWKQAAKHRRENREWLNKSAAIAVKVLEALNQQNLSQKDLAERMSISPQQINKIVKGQENLTLETISKLETALGIQIIPGLVSHGKSAA